jgi:hypothetical protein
MEQRLAIHGWARGIFSLPFSGIVIRSKASRDQPDSQSQENFPPGLEDQKNYFWKLMIVSFSV